MNENPLPSAQPARQPDWLDELRAPDVEASHVEAWSAAWSSWVELLEEAEPPPRKTGGEGLPARAMTGPQRSAGLHAESQALRPHYAAALRGVIAAAVAASLFLACSVSLSPWQKKNPVALAVAGRSAEVPPDASVGQERDAAVSHGNRASSGDDERTTVDVAPAMVAWEAQEAEVDWRLGRVGRLLETWDQTMQPDDARIYFANQVLSSLAWELDQSEL